LCTFLSDWPCLSTSSDAETQARIKSAIRRYIVDAGKDASDESEALAVLFQTRLTVTHRIALFDGLSGLSNSVVKVVGSAAVSRARVSPADIGYPYSSSQKASHTYNASTRTITQTVSLGSKTSFVMPWTLYGCLLARGRFRV
jgi:hypothetical protein